MDARHLRGGVDRGGVNRGGVNRGGGTTGGATTRTQAIRALAEQHANRRGPLLPILHAVADEYGYIDDADIPVIAHVLNLSRAEVLGVVTFYHDFRRTPPAQHRIQLCRAEACQSVGAHDLFAVTRETYADDPGVEVSEVFCLGNCALGPAGMVDGRLLGRLTRERLSQALAGASEVGP
ncbi:MAG: formate dehydrogenase [Actinomycetales bacterium]|nr:formate dehydrogenase [Actinomycetales bacterium]